MRKFTAPHGLWMQRRADKCAIPHISAKKPRGVRYFWLPASRPLAASWPAPDAL